MDRHRRNARLKGIATLVGLFDLLALIYLLVVVASPLLLLPLLFVESQIAIVVLLWYVLRELSARNAAEGVTPPHD